MNGSRRRRTERAASTEWWRVPGFVGRYGRAGSSAANIRAWLIEARLFPRFGVFHDLLRLARDFFDGRAEQSLDRRLDERPRAEGEQERGQKNEREEEKHQLRAQSRPENASLPIDDQTHEVPDEDPQETQGEGDDRQREENQQLRGGRDRGTRLGDRTLDR